MSGLASYGALGGGGTVAGLVVLGAAPAHTSVAIMHHALRRYDDLPGPEGAARTTRRIGPFAGAAAGAACVIAAPAAAAAIVGYLLYRIALWLASPVPPVTATTRPASSAG